MNNKNKISNLYKSTKISEIDLESKINYRLDYEKKRYHRLTVRTVFIAALILTLTAIIAFAAVKVITEADGSHTLLNEENEKTWTVTSTSAGDQINHNMEEIIDKVGKEMSGLKPQGEQAKVAYYDYSEIYEPYYFIWPIYDKFYINDDNYDVFKDSSKTPDFFYDVLEVTLQEFDVSCVKYDYQVSEEQREEIKKIYSEKSTFGEVYAEVVLVDKVFWAVELTLLTRDMDKFINASIVIFNDSAIQVPGSSEVGFETVMIKNQISMFSKRSDGSYILSTDVNGFGISFKANPRGNPENMIEFIEKLMTVLEEY
jgi:hypothetical protein